MVQNNYNIHPEEILALKKLKFIQLQTLTAIESVLYAFADTDEEELTESQQKALERLYEAYAKNIEA